MVTFDYKKTPITQIADYIIMYSAKNGASDIHFDPHENGLMVRIRIDGDLRDYTLVPVDYERNLITRLKLLANMNITESRLPQDGSIKGKFGNLFLDMRVSSLPTNEGEKIVIRILDYSMSLEGLENLGFSHTNYEKLKRMIAVPNGIVLVTGATGSGKSTTTYSILQTLNRKEVNIITVEDPVEMNIEGLNQVQVNSEIGLDFATVLRSILRQDPNVILIGEIRDSETAKIAVRASITGHFVLSTIHTNNSLSTIERLLDMDVERYLLSSALTGIISQRLAKKICTKCRITREPTEYEKKIFMCVLDKDIDSIYDANHDGCSECHNGYKGRIAIQEVLEIDDDIRLAINNENLTKEELKNLVYTDNVITLLQDGLYKVLDGITSFEEIYRIIEIDSDVTDNYNKKILEENKEETTDNNDGEEETPKIDNNEVVSSSIQALISNNNEENEMESSEEQLDNQNNLDDNIDNFTTTDSTQPLIDTEIPNNLSEEEDKNQEGPQLYNYLDDSEPQIVSSTAAPMISANTQSLLNQSHENDQDNDSEPTLIELPKFEVEINQPTSEPKIIENEEIEQDPTLVELDDYYDDYKDDDANTDTNNNDDYNDNNDIDIDIDTDNDTDSTDDDINFDTNNDDNDIDSAMPKIVSETKNNTP